MHYRTGALQSMQTASNWSENDILCTQFALSWCSSWHVPGLPDNLRVNEHMRQKNVIFVFSFSSLTLKMNKGSKKKRTLISLKIYATPAKLRAVWSRSWPPETSVCFLILYLIYPTPGIAWFICPFVSPFLTPSNCSTHTHLVCALDAHP